MKKMLLMVFVLVGFAHEAGAMEPESSETQDCTLEFSDHITDDEKMIIQQSLELLLLNPNEQKTLDGKHWLLLKKAFSLNFLESRMTQQSKKDNGPKLNAMRDSFWQDIQLLRDEEKKMPQEAKLDNSPNPNKIRDRFQEDMQLLKDKKKIIKRFQKGLQSLRDAQKSMNIQEQIVKWQDMAFMDAAQSIRDEINRESMRDKMNRK